MKRVAVVFAFIGAIAALTGVFLPWIHYSIGGNISYSLSGWGVFHNTSWFDNIVLSMFKLDSNTHALIAFIAAIVMLVCALPAVFLSLKAKGDSAAVKPLVIIVALAAVAVLVGVIWFLVDMSSAKNWSDYLGYGVYVCGGGALLGLIFGALAAVKGK